MVALYGLVLSHDDTTQASLPPSTALVIDDVIKTITGNTALSKTSCMLSGALGIVIQSDFVGLYWNENAADLEHSTPQVQKKILLDIKENLHIWVKKVQA